MKSVIVTGASGFLGRPAVKHLLDLDYEVHAVASKSDLKIDPHPSLYTHKFDLLDINDREKLFATIQPSHFLHLAWYVEHGKFWSSLQNIDWLEASIDLLQKFADGGGKRFVATGTCYEYDFVNANSLSETGAVLRPTSLYAASKVSAFHVMEALANLRQLSFGWGRIFFLFGERENENRLVPYVIRSLLHGDVARCSHGNQVRDFADTDFVANGLARFLDSDVQGAVNVCSGAGVSLRELIDQIIRIVGGRGSVDFGAIEAPPDDPPVIIGDTSRLVHEVGYKRKFDLSGDLERVVEWWKKYECD